MENKISVAQSFFPGAMSRQDVVKVLTECGIHYGELFRYDGDQLTEIAEEKEFRKFIDDMGFCFQAGHLPFKTDLLTGGQRNVDQLKRWIERYAELGISEVVLHCGYRPDAGIRSMFEKNVAIIRQLAEFMKDSSIYLCLENIPNPLTLASASLLEMIEAAGGGNIGICLDTGHLNINTRYGVRETPGEFIRTAGARLKALHINDNEGRPVVGVPAETNLSDQHMLPFGRGTVKWAEVMLALEETGYSGLFNFEVSENAGLPVEMLKMKLRYLREMAEFMLNMNKPGN